MNEKDLLLIKTLFEEKNITHTAKRLFISQPAISDRLQRLESELNCALIVRQPRGISFTSEGEILYQYALNHLQDYEQLKATLSSDRDTTRGVLKIGCSNIFSKYKLPPLLSKFMKLYPQIDVSMRSGYSHNRFKDFLEGNIHVCIARGNHNWQEKKTFLWKEPLCIFSKEIVETSQLLNMPYIHYITDPLLQNVLDEWWYSLFNTPPKTIIEVDAMDTALKLVQQGIGYTLLSQSCTTDAPNLYASPLFYKSGQPVMRSTYMYYRNNYIHFAATKAFVDFMNIHIQDTSEEILSINTTL